MIHGHCIRLTWNYCQSHSAKWSASCSALPYVTTNVIPGFDTRQVQITSYTLSRWGYLDGRDTLHRSKKTYEDYTNDRADTTIMDKIEGKTKNKIEIQPHPPIGCWVSTTSQRPASVETVQGGRIPPYVMIETMVVNVKKY